MSLNKKINSNKTKHVLVENKLEKLKTFDSSYFRDKNHFEEDGVQNYLVFQPLYKYFKKIGNTNNISEWKFKGLSNEITEPPDNTLTPTLKYTGKKMNVKFN